MPSVAVLPPPAVPERQILDRPEKFHLSSTQTAIQGGFRAPGQAALIPRNPDHPNNTAVCHPVPCHLTRPSLLPLPKWQCSLRAQAAHVHNAHFQPATDAVLAKPPASAEHQLNANGKMAAVRRTRA